MAPARHCSRWPRVLAVALLGGLATGGCFTSSDGLEPPLDRFYFPTGLAVTSDAEDVRVLYVANSDFDLRYNGGTVQAVDLPALRTQALKLRDALREQTMPGGQGAAAGCAAVGLSVNPNPLLNPGPCTSLDAAAFIKQSRIIGAFASGAILVQQPNEGRGRRLYVPVRGDPSVTFFDVAGPGCGDDRFCLDCGAGADKRCTALHRIGEDPSENVRGLRLPLEPVGIAAGPWTSFDAGGTPTRGVSAIVTAHQTQGAASLIVDRWEGKPTLESYITGLSAGPTEVYTLPVPAVVPAYKGALDYQPGFLLTFRATPELDLLRFQDDQAAAPDRPFLTRGAAIGITTNASGFDSRGVAVDPSERQACETACAQGDTSCYTACADIPIRLFVANRAPASLLIGLVHTEIVEPDDDNEQKSAYETMELYDTVPLSYGASHVAIGNVIGDDGAPHLRVFAVAFDSRLIFSYDPEARRIDAVIRTGRGPHAIAFDSGKDAQGRPYAFMIVSHFTDSYLGIVDLDMGSPETFGSMFLALGEPAPPAEAL